MPDKMRREEAVKRLAEMVGDIDFAMLTTIDGDGQLRSRPMKTQKTSETGALWFLAQNDSPKSAEIEHQHQVNVCYADPSQKRYVSVSGFAEIICDRKKIEEYWKPQYAAWLPKGKDDPHLCLIKVQPEKAEFWTDRENKKTIF